MKTYEHSTFTGERAQFAAQNARYTDCIFKDGESPLKESADLLLDLCSFCWKYPLWYCKNVEVKDSVWEYMARAGVWYTENVALRDCIVHAPKNFRRCAGVTLENVVFTRAEETLWACSGVKLKNVTAKGDYFAMNCSDIEVDSLTLDGNYSFDGAKNVVVRNSKLLSKDAFWNCENVEVYDSFVSGEYFGWNSKNVTLVNCTIESLQGLCCIENLKMVGCRLPETTLAFEYSTVDAEILSHIDSVFNPASGRIRAESIGELILEKGRIDPDKTEITADVKVRSDKPEWLK